MKSGYRKIFLKNQVLKNISGGHPWCFSGAIERIEPGISNGDLCSVYCQGNFAGIGYYNGNTDIAVRIITRLDQPVDRNFFVKRFEELKRDREELPGNSNACRIAFGESDNLPGLIADKYGDVIVIQIHTLGMERLKDEVAGALAEVFKPQMIYEKSDAGSRRREGIDSESSSVLYGRLIEEVEITENGFKFCVNIVHGQKTGFFLDQRQNRLALVDYCRGKNVLNCFSYTGGFSVYAAGAAKKVTSVDVSKRAIEAARKNFTLNGFNPDDHEFVAADVFEYLNGLEKGKFDVIILDPPSFAKNRRSLANAIKAYTTINTKALENLDDYGILVSSSCTTHVDELTFIKILHQSSVNAGCQLKVLESKVQPPDHPYNLAFPEGRYLKYFILRKHPVV